MTKKVFWQENAGLLQFAHEGNFDLVPETWDLQKKRTPFLHFDLSGHPSFFSLCQNVSSSLQFLHPF